MDEINLSIDIGIENLADHQCWGSHGNHMVMILLVWVKVSWLILVVPFSTALKCVPIQGWRNSGCGLNDSNITVCWSKQGLFKNNHAVKFLACGQKRRETWWVPAPWTWRVCYATAVLFMVTNCLRRWVCILQKVTFSHLPPTWYVSHMQQDVLCLRLNIHVVINPANTRTLTLLGKICRNDSPSIQESQSCKLVTFYFLSHLNDENITTCVRDEQIKTRGNDSHVERRVTLERIKATDCWVSGTVKEVSCWGMAGAGDRVTD